MHERRCSAHPVGDLFPALDSFVDLESIPAPLIVPEDLIRREIELEDLARLAARAGGEHSQKEVREDAKEENDKYREARDQKHGSNHTERKQVLSLFLQWRSRPLLELIISHDI